MLTAINFVLQAIECLVTFSFYESITEYKNHTVNRFAIMFGGYVAMFVVNIAFGYNIVINSAAMILFHFAFAKFLYNRKLVFSCLYAALITALVTITEFSAANLIALWFNTAPKEFTSSILIYTILIIFSKSFLYILLRIISSLINKIRGNEQVSAIFLTYPVSLLIILTIVTIITDGIEISNEKKLFLSAAMLFLAFSILATCVFQQVSSRRDRELAELKAAKQKQEMDEIYFDLLEHQNEELQYFVHDTKNHLLNIYNVSDDPQKTQEYIKTLIHDLDEANRIGKTSSKMLDLILSKYAFLCEKKSVKFIRDIHKSDLDFIKDSDLTSIFNNLLDNAVEAAQDSKEKSISLSINSIGNMIHVDLRNSCDAAPVTQNKRLVTRKTDKGLHGYGYKSVARTVKKYGADIAWDYSEENKEFSVSIIFQR